MQRYEVLTKGFNGEWLQHAITEASPSKIRLSFPLIDHWVLSDNDSILTGYMSGKGLEEPFVKIIVYSELGA